MTDEEITKAAREICAAQAGKKDSPESYNYLVGNYDHTIWMRLVEQGIRKGIEGQTMIKTQHCPNCETTEQKLHDFQQKVSDAVVEYRLPETRERGFEKLKSFIITKPDSLVDVFDECFNTDVLEGETWSESMARKTRAALEARGLEIREKGQ
jgi:hypothetical protein